MTDIERLDESDAHDLDAAIRGLAAQVHVALEALYVLVEQAKATNLHVTLGFPSWTAYIADALDGQWRLTGDKRAEVVRFLAGQGMSQRAIARVTGASKGAIHRELGQVPHLGHLVVGLDGKEYPRDVPHSGAPAEDIARDIALDKELTRLGEDLWQHRWHWTLDESEPRAGQRRAVRGRGRCACGAPFAPTRRRGRCTST